MLDAFREIVLVDFEFETDHGDRPKPLCMVAKEVRSGRVWRLWRGEFGPAPPYPTDASTLFIAFYASADIGCHLALNWPVPLRVLDLYVEFRRQTNKLKPVSGNGLTGALVHFGLPLPLSDKDFMRAMILGGGPWDENQRRRILDYCTEDVAALARLLPAMLPKISLGHALLRGRYMTAAARMEWAGVPIDTAMLARLRHHWLGIQDTLIEAVDRDYGVYDGRSFKADRFSRWLSLNGIPWPRHVSGALDLNDKVFKEQAKIYQIITPLRELRSSMSKLKLHDLTVGRDGRNRTVLWAFKSSTGRNQPSSSRFVFGPAVWIRGLIKPPPGYAVCYVDWSSQELGIAAAESGDTNLQTAYLSGNPYLGFAKQAGAAPPEATKKTHGALHELYKAVVLGVGYGMGSRGLAGRLDQPPIVAANLLAQHRQVYRRFWQWSDAVVDQAVLTGTLDTVFGWTVHVGADFNPRSLRNFPMQGNGAEMLRLACCLATERGVEVCAPVHDALLICSPFDRIHADIATTRAAMAEASRVVLDGFELRTDVHMVPWPRRYMDERGRRMWDTVMSLIDAADRERATA